MHARWEMLLARLEALGRRLDAPEQGWVTEDAKALTIQVLESVAPVLNFPRLDQQARQEVDVDARAVHDAVDLIRGVPSEDFQLGEKTFDATKRLERLDVIVASAYQVSGLSPLEWALRRSLVGDGTLDLLLTALRGHDDVRTRIRDAVRKKLDWIDDAEALELLARYEDETADSRDPRIMLRDDVIPRDFFRVETPQAARDKSADYVVLLRPVLERHMVESGQTYMPALDLGIVSILSWTAHRNLVLDSETRQTVEAVSRVAVFWRDVLREDADALASALRVPVEGHSVTGRGIQQARQSLDGKKPCLAGLLAELEKLVHMAVSASAAHPIEEALRWYKAGVEVMGGESREALIERPEPLLTRDVCRFLVERGHSVMGATLGRHAMDLRAQDTVATTIIETKKRKGVPTEAEIRAWFTQLQTYMSEESLHNRGVLLIYNFSEIPIIAPQGYVHGRYLVVAINLCEATASDREGSIVIEEASDPKIFVNIRRNIPKARSKRTEE